MNLDERVTVKHGENTTLSGTVIGVRTDENGPVAYKVRLDDGRMSWYNAPLVTPLSKEIRK